MLQSVRAGSLPLSQGAFIDRLNNQVCFLGQGGQLHLANLHEHTHPHPASQPLPLAVSSPGSHQSLPSLVVVSGQALTDAGRSMASAISEELVLRSSWQVVDGAHWQWHAPISLQRVKLGLCRVDENEETRFELIDFNSSTPRNVTFAVEGGKLRVWVNGHPFTRTKKEDLVYDGAKNKWYPCAKLQDRGNTIIFSPFTTVPLGTASALNPFGRWCLDEPPIENAPVSESEYAPKVTKLIQLSKDKFLVQWQNSSVRVFYRNETTGRFDYGTLSVSQEGIIKNAFTPQQHALLKEWRGEASLFPQGHTFTLNNMAAWIRYLISCLDSSAPTRTDLYTILLHKLAIIRPYLPASQKIPNPIRALQHDLAPYHHIMQYFSTPIYTTPILVPASQTRSALQFHLQGSIEAVTEHYLLTRKENTVIVYSIRETVTEVFRETVDRKLVFSKRTATKAYEEDDIRNLKSEGSFLYKILSSCLQKERKSEQPHSVNQNDVKELVRDYGIDEAAAREALQETGHVEQALVWIFTDRKQNKGKRGQSLKDIENEGVESVRLVQLDHVLARLLLQVGPKMFVLGVVPSEARHWLHKGEKECVDLLTLKHEDEVESLGWRGWFAGDRHPKLHILDQLDAAAKPELLFREGGVPYLLSQEQGVFMKRRIEFNAELLYEPNQCISLSPAEPLPFFPREPLSTTIQGELISQQLIESRTYLPDTFWSDGKELYTNLTHNLVRTNLIRLQLAESIAVSGNKEVSALPFTVESGPPGCSSNYSITSLLHPRTSFLANYPQPIVLRHLHNKLIHAASLIMHRSSHRKNINYITSGELYLIDQWGSHSATRPFSFGEGQNEKSIDVGVCGYWKYVVIVPKFTNIKKLPFQYGYIQLIGSDLSQELHNSQYLQITTMILTKQLKAPLTAISAQSRRGKTSVLAKLQDASVSIGEISHRAKELSMLTTSNEVVEADKLADRQEVAFLAPPDIIKLLYPPSAKIEDLLRRISRSPLFNFSAFSKTEVFKFVDLTLYYTGSLLQLQDYFGSLFGKLWGNQFGQQYLLQLAQSLHSAPTVPFPYLRLLLPQMKSGLLVSTLKAILDELPKVRSPRYGQINGKHVHLVLENEFYSDYYLNLIEGKNHQGGSLYGEPLLEAEFVSLKDEYCRRLIIKLPSCHRVTSLTLRIERNEQTSKLNYSVFAIRPQGKQRIGSGRIQEHQWAQVSREAYKSQQITEKAKYLSVYGLDVSIVAAHYLQVELTFSQSGIVGHQSETARVPQGDIIPELYGYPTDSESRMESLESIFSFNPEQMFFLSSVAQGTKQLQKYSVSKGKQTQCLYFRPHRDDEAALRAKIQEKAEKGDFEGVPALQRKLIASATNFSNRICLDYLYTMLVLTLGELQQRGEKLQEALCKDLFSLVVKITQGPIKAAAFRAISKNIPLLLKSLQFVQEQLSKLGRLTFSYEELLACIDPSNAELCQSLTGLILRVVEYEPRWTELLIRMSSKTQRHEEIARYFLAGDDWLQNTTIVGYVDDFPEPFFEGTFLPLLSYKQLCALATRKCSGTRLELLLEVIVEKASAECQVDLDVVGLIFRQEEVRWEQLEKVVTCCPQAVDTVVHQFMQADNCEVLALQHDLLLTTAAAPKYSEEFAQFLSRIYAKNRSIFKEVMLNLAGKCNLLHYDAFETISAFIFISCDFGGIEGVRLLTEDDLSNLHVAVQALRIVQPLPQGAEVPNEEGFVQWYLTNNDYEDCNRNPANKAQGYHLIRKLAEQVSEILRNTSSSRVLAKYAELVQKLKGSRKTSLFQKHLRFGQLHHGATQLLAHSLAPGGLAQVLVGPNPALPTVLNELKASVLRGANKKQPWVSKETDITEKFEIKTPQIKDLQGGKVGTKASTSKIPINQKTFRLESQQTQWPSKFLIGFALNDHTDNKNAILPTKAELYVGNGSALFKAGYLKAIQDQYYLSFGVRVFGINLNSVSVLGSTPIRSLQVRLAEPSLSSASEVLENGQRSKKGATFNLSFVAVSGYEGLPAEQPDYSQLYVTLLGFLGQQKYLPDLRKVVASQLFDQKLELIIQVLNDLLPNESIETLLLSLNRQGENILEHVLRSKGANPHLVSRLLLGKLTRDNIAKLLAYTLQNMSKEYVDITNMSIRIASHAVTDKTASKTVLDFSNIERLIEKYLSTEGEVKQLYFQILAALLTVPHFYHYEIGKLVQLTWNSSRKSELYLLLAAVLPYYQQQTQVFAGNGYTLAILDELLKVIEENRKEDSVLKNPLNHISLLNTLITNQSSLSLLVSVKAPIQIVELLKSEKSLLLKYPTATMRQFISFFQGTCIGTECQDEFSQILISLMTSLNNFDAAHHQFFIQNFFFPLINAFKGVPMYFLWKHGQERLWQPTDVLRKSPIRSNAAVLLYKEKLYAPLDSIVESSVKGELIIVHSESNQVAFKFNGGQVTDVQVGRILPFIFSQGKITITISEGNKVTLPNQSYTVYEQSEWEQHLLTNATLINLNNPWILQEKYRALVPLRESTAERCYFLPQEITIAQLLKNINISGFRVNSKDLPNIKLVNFTTGTEISHDWTLKKVLEAQSLPFLQIQVEAAQLFTSTTIQTLVEESPAVTAFIPQETIFKAFQEKKGLQKLIGVLRGCVKNWANAEQSKIWEQYLKELESYSCFPVFSSLYMTKQANVALLFDLLFGLPDRQDGKKWLQREKQSVRELYAIIKDVFAVQGQQAQVVRSYALKSGFYATMLNRLHLITKEPRRQKAEEEAPQEQELVPASLERKQTEQDFKAKLTKRKGVGYGTDSSTNQKWDVSGQQAARKEQSEQILGLLNILEKFLDNKDFELPDEIINDTFESALLPIIENSLRGGSLLEISKYAELIQGELNFIQILARTKKLIPTLMSVPKIYEPRQPQSLHSLLKTLANTSKIFLSCLTGSASEKVSQQIAKKITTTFQLVDSAVSEYQTAHNDEEEDRKVLELPLSKKYPILLKDLRFDYIEMKDSTGKITKHHYASYYQPGHKSPVEKTIRLAQELADVSHALPIDHTNAIFVRCDRERVDYMQALIMGSNGTPYGHGAYLFDIYFEDTYPSGPPKVNLTTTGNGQIRFNPNLYACGKVCLSLLGTWQGSAMEKWDPKMSTLLQVLVSIQSIIMSEDIYFNEPGFEPEQGTVQGEKKNQAYANIVRYGNVKFAMLENIRNPPKGFQTIIRRHFYLKREEILQECQRWLKLAEKREASYSGLVSDHNHSWSATFRKSKGEYKTMLEKAVKELQGELNKLPPPTHEDLRKEQSPTKPKRKNIKSTNDKPQDQVALQEIDVSYGGARENIELDINDQRVKDRWSRYIGAMGVEAVSKQSKADILLLGLGGLGIQIAKNIVLSGCREFAVWDDQPTQWSDLSGQFFLGAQDVGKPRLDCSIYKLQELNHYVKVSKFEYNSEDLSSVGRFKVVIATGLPHEQQLKLDQFCRSSKIPFLSADCYGPYGQVFNDFGDDFQILDKNGEETVEVILDDISIAEKGVVRVSKGLRHPYEDGETVRISGVRGMDHKQQEGASINGTLHKVEVIDQFSFRIGSTLDYTPYQADGTVRNIKTPKKLGFKPLGEAVSAQSIDPNLQYYDFSKGGNLPLLHQAMIGLSNFRGKHSRLPSPWNKQDAGLLLQEVKALKADLSEDDTKYVQLFSYTCSGNFGPICAFYGGIVSQEVFKAITGKYTPIHQYFLADFSEIVDHPPKEDEAWDQFALLRQPTNDRRDGIRRIIGEQLLSKLQSAKVFMVGSGAIGCELLKNFAMLEVGAGQGGSVVVTDPDHIETSNLNRQFLFREKHLRKPKSATAAAAVSQMNPRLKGHIKARLDKVCQATKDIFSNQFFQGLSIVTNALDNVQARRYVDSRCVENKVALLESGTLSSKGHVQVIIPYLTETYGSKQDPNDANGEVPHCTLKMFPEETLHCVEWARDLFGKDFTLAPKALAKLLQSEKTFSPTPSDTQMLKDCLKMLSERPANFEQAAGTAARVFYQLFRNDILQLLYTYPLDAKTKDGKPFWRLPKRPPTPIERIQPEDPLHSTFIAAYAVLLSKVHAIPFPKDFRDPAKRREITEVASKFKVEPFVPSDKAAQEMTEEVNNQDKQQQEGPKQEVIQQGEAELFERFKTALAELRQGGDNPEAKAEQFQKDQDQNGHIDVIYSMANLRARNYKLQEMEWIGVKLKAGRIMPALSTTTSCIAALQTIELVKYLKGCKPDAMRNAFINLAVPLVQLGEPGEVQKIKVHENLQTNLWQRWGVELPRTSTLQELMTRIQEKYGVVVKCLSLLQGGQVYSDIVLGLQSKKQERERLLAKPLLEVLQAEEIKYVDVTLVMGLKEKEELIKHAPTLRVALL